MLIFRSTDWYKDLSPQETQQIIDQWMAWFKNLTDQGIAIGGNPLENEGRIVNDRRLSSAHLRMLNIGCRGAKRNHNRNG